MSDCRRLAVNVDRLRRALAISGYPRPTLLAELRLRKAAGRSTPQLKVVDVIDLGDGHDVLCRCLIADRDARSFIAPPWQIALDRRHPLAQARAPQRRPPRAGTA